MKADGGNRRHRQVDQWPETQPRVERSDRGDLHDDVRDNPAIEERDFLQPVRANEPLHGTERRQPRRFQHRRPDDPGFDRTRNVGVVVHFAEMPVVEQMEPRERGRGREDERQVRHDRGELVRCRPSEHEAMRALVNKDPQGMIDRRADDVRDWQPDVPTAVAHECGECELRDDEGDDPHGARRRRPREFAHGGMCLENLAASCRVLLNTRHVDVIGAGHGFDLTGTRGDYVARND